MFKLRSKKSLPLRLQPQDGLRFETDWTTAPGESLQEAIEVEGFTPEQAAETSGIPYPVFLGVLNGAVPITEDIAKKLTKVARYSVQFWLNSEKRYQYDIKRLGWQRPTCPETEQYYTANGQA